jgi:hypothetical protein
MADYRVTVSFTVQTQDKLYGPTLENVTKKLILSRGTAANALTEVVQAFTEITNDLFTTEDMWDQMQKSMKVASNG